MNDSRFHLLTEKWCNLPDSAQVVIVTDDERRALAQEIREGISDDCRIIVFNEPEQVLAELAGLSPADLVIALFSIDGFVKGGANRVFSPFSKPQGIAAKYAFIRLGISAESLLEGLGTPKELVCETIREFNRYGQGSRLVVTSPAGTDITLQVSTFTTCSHEITENGGTAFLPPSEITSEVIPGTANGRIAVDVTVGQLYYYGEMRGYFGLVESPVRIDVADGVVTDVTGGAMARELREKWFALPEPCRTLVELGHGLSKMKPTGLIGVDESMIDTCHFGFGNAGTCGVHLDVVVGSPAISEL